VPAIRTTVGGPRGRDQRDRRSRDQLADHPGEPGGLQHARAGDREARRRAPAGVGRGADHGAHRQRQREPRLLGPAAHDQRRHRLPDRVRHDRRRLRDRLAGAAVGAGSAARPHRAQHDELRRGREPDLERLGDRRDPQALREQRRHQHRLGAAHPHLRQRGGGDPRRRQHPDHLEPRGVGAGHHHTPTAASRRR
jgi:hypothetical protein